MLRTPLASLIILVAGAATLAFATDGFHAFTSETARRVEVREHPRPLPDTPLQTTQGQIVHLSALRGRWLLVEFIYTRCMTFCSVQGGDFARLQRSLAAPIAAGKVSLLSISFDPAHDSPAKLADYQRRFGDDGDGWIAARPTSAPGLAQLTRVFGVTAVPDGFGGFVHNAAIAVVDPSGRLVEIMDWDDPAAAARFVIQRLAR